MGKSNNWATPEQTRAHLASMQSQRGGIRAPAHDDDDDDDGDGMQLAIQQSRMEQQHQAFRRRHAHLNQPIDGLAPGPSRSFAQRDTMTLAQKQRVQHEARALRQQLVRNGDLEPLRDHLLIQLLQATTHTRLTCDDAIDLLDNVIPGLVQPHLQWTITHTEQASSPASAASEIDATLDYFIARFGPMMKQSAHAYTRQRQLARIPGGSAVYNGFTLLKSMLRCYRTPSFGNFLATLSAVPWAAMVSQPLLTQAARIIWEQLTPALLQEWVEQDDGRATWLFVATGVFLSSVEWMEGKTTIAEQLATFKANTSLLVRDPFGFIMQQLNDAPTGTARTVPVAAASRPMKERIIDHLAEATGFVTTVTGLLKSARQQALQPSTTSGRVSTASMLGELHIAAPGQGGAPGAGTGIDVATHYQLWTQFHQQLSKQHDNAPATRPPQTAQTAPASNPGYRLLPNGRQAASLGGALATATVAGIPITLALTAVGAGLYYLLAEDPAASSPASMIGESTSPALSATSNSSTQITIDDVTTGESSDSGNSAQTSTSDGWVNFPVPAHWEIQGDAPAPTNELQIFRTNLTNTLSAAHEVFAFVEGQLLRLTDPANRAFSVNELLADSADSLPSEEPASTLKGFLTHLGIDLPSRDAKLGTINIAPLNHSLALIQEIKSETAYFKNISLFADPAALAALRPEMAWIHTLPQVPPVRNRDMWKALTNGRNLVALYDLRQSARYSGLVSGYTNLVTANQGTIQTQLLCSDFLLHAAADFRRTFGVPANDPTNAAAAKFQEWVHEVKALYSRTAAGDLQSKLQQYKDLLKGNIGDAAKRQQLKELLQTEAIKGLTQKLLDKLKTLPSDVLAGSKVEKYRDRSQRRLDTMTSGRALTSVPALLGVGTRIVGAIYANSARDQVINTLGALEELFAAYKIPHELAVNAWESARSGGQSFQTTFKEKAWTPSKLQFQEMVSGAKKKLHINGETIEMTRRGGTEGYVIPSKRLQDTSVAVSKNVAKMASRDPLTFHNAEKRALQLRGQMPFVLQDITSAVLNIYTFASKENITNDAERAELGLKITASLAYLSGTTLGTFVKGHRQVILTRGLNGAGVAANIAAGIANVIKVSETDSPNTGRNTALAATQLVADTAGMIGAIALPLLGTLFTLLIPNFASIGSALDYRDTARQLEREGKLMEASIAWSLREMAILDATPVINWFAFIYQPVYMERNTVQSENIDTTVAANVIAQLQALRHNFTRDLPNHVGNTDVYPMLITPVTLQVNYTRNNPGPITPHLPRSFEERQSITVWAAYGKGSNQVYVFPDQIMHTVTWPNGVHTARSRYTDLQNHPSLRNIAYASRPVLAESVANQKIPELTFINGRSGNIDTSGMTLNVDNRRIGRPAIYIMEDQGNGLLNMTSNDKDSQIVANRIPNYLNGGGGINTLDFSDTSTVSHVNLNQLRNISIVHGPMSARSVTGNVNNMFYATHSDNRQEKFNVTGTNNTVQATNASDIRFQQGDNRVLAQGIPRSAVGGGGNDLLSFKFSSLQGISLDGNSVTTHPASDEQGTIAAFDIVQLTENNDLVQRLTAQTGIKVLDVGAGNDTVSGHGITNFTLYLGAGHDAVTITAPAPYNNYAISGDDQPKSISMEIKGENNSIITGGSNNSISLNGMDGTNNSVMLALGGQGNVARLAGNIAVDYHLARRSGAGVIHDSLSRTHPLQLYFRGDLQQKDVVSSLFFPIDNDGAIQVLFYIKDKEGAEQLVLTVHTWPSASMLCSTEGDGQTRPIG